MNNRQFAILMLLIAIAVGAVVSAQLYWIYNAYKLQEANFSNSIQQALIKATSHVEANNSCFEAFNKITLGEKQDILMLRRDAEGSEIVDTVRQYISSFDDDSLKSFDDLSASFPVTAEILVKYHYTPKEAVSATSILNLHNSRHSFKKEEQNEIFSGTFPLSYLGDPEYYTNYIDSVISLNINNEGLNPEYYFALKDAKTDSTFLTNVPEQETLAGASSYVSTFYNNSSFYTPQELQIWIPRQNRYVLNNIVWVLAGSFLVLLFLGAVVWVIVRTLLKQKKLSEMKNDFINNMTHEFKTPISNISLALQTIGALNSKASSLGLQDYLTVISAENNRLSNNVEKILQLSVMDHEKARVKKEMLNIESLITEVVRSFDMLMENMGGEIKTHFASGGMIYGDKVHLSNVFHNLVDNAIKYNHTAPHLVIRTFEMDNNIIISVSDNGIGISQDNIQYIFDRFYRVSTGNVHDVKGFGLGLSYVKEIVEIHEGEIAVRSKQGKGTIFTIVLPRKQPKERGVYMAGVRKLLGIW